MMNKERAALLNRLNELLDVAHTDLALLTDQKFDALIERLFHALQVEKNQADHFHVLATRENVKEAAEGLEQWLEPLQVGAGAHFELEKQHLYVRPDKDGRFSYSFLSDDLPTRIYSAFVRLLRESETTPADLLTCSSCRKVFVPLRERKKSERVFCSRKCSNLIASREYRYRTRKEEELRERERERSHRKHKARLEKIRNRPTKVNRYPRKRKTRPE